MSSTDSLWADFIHGSLPIQLLWNCCSFTTFWCSLESVLLGSVFEDTLLKQFAEVLKYLVRICKPLGGYAAYSPPCTKDSDGANRLGLQT